MMSYTNTMRLLGINSGMDTESLIKNMMQAESMKLQRMQRNIISLSWKQEAYRNVYSDLSSFQKTFLDLSSATSFRLTTMFRTSTQSIKTSAGQDSNAVSVGANTKEGKYAVKIDRLAEADLYESTSKIGGDISSEAGFKFDASNIKEGASYEITLNGASKKISFTKDDVAGISDNDSFIALFNQKLKDAFGTEGTGNSQQVEAKLTANGGVSIFTNGYHTGFSIADGSYLSSSSVAGSSPVFSGGKATSDQSLSFDITYNGEKKTISADIVKDMSIDELVGVLNKQLEGNDLGSKLQFGVDVDTGNIKLTGNSLTGELEIKDGGNGKDSLAHLGFSGDKISLSPTSSLSALGITSGSAAKFDADRTLSEIFDSDLTKETTFTINGKEFSFTGDTKMSDLMNEVNSAGLGVTLRYDEHKEVFQLESNKTGHVNKINMSGEFLKENLGFGETAKRAAVDSVATINGVTLTRATNEYEFEGVSWTLNKTTENDTITVEVSRNVDSIVDNIKSFVESYNEMIDKLSKTTSATRPKSNGSYGSYYEPLLDEEKSQMTESQIAMWEERAKTGLLNRDSIITGIVAQLRSALSQSVTLDDGSKISLHELGITTSSNWREGGKLVIDEDKLRKTVTERGDDVMTLFSKGPSDGAEGKARFDEGGLASRMNIIINTATSPNGSIASKAGIVGYRSESDNAIIREIRSENDRVNLMLNRLADKETYYYNLFARMESAMAKSNSQMNYLMSITGGGQ